MSAGIPSTTLMSDLLKATGYDCPVALQGLTFEEAISGAGISLEDNKTASITANGTVEITPSTGKYAMKKVTATVAVATEVLTVSIASLEAGEILPTEGKLISKVVVTE